VLRTIGVTLASTMKLVLALALASLTIGCKREAAAPAPGLETLDASRLPALREAFNRDLEHPRILALLSPT
jgi:hypothetical protein